MAKDVGLKSGIPQRKIALGGWKVLLYGLTGAGKTRTASLFPKPLFFDFEHGLGSVTEKVAWVEIENWKQWLGWQSKLLTTGFPVKTLVLDSMNALQRKAMENSVQTYSTKRAHGDIPGQSDYGKMFWDVWRSVTELFDLPYNIVITAQAYVGNFDELTHPQFIGQAMGEPLLQSMDLVGYVEREGPKTVRIWFDKPDAVTKDRFGWFGEEPLVNPTWEDIEGRVKAPKTTETLPEIKTN